MPSAAPDAASRARFIGDHGGLLDLAGLGTDAPVGIALSGGPDSIALLLLAASACAGPVKAMTVDHGLRPEAAHEAAAMSALCATLAIPHETARLALDRHGQSPARTARYTALAAWARRERLAAVLTAHHADDQAETMLMRLARGAGLAGLAGIRALRPIDARIEPVVMLLRPLLGWRKVELEAIVAGARIVPFRDPSNIDRRYDRTRARGLLSRDDWLDPARLAASASHIAEAEAALVELAGERYHVTDEGGDVILRIDPIREIARRHLLRVLGERFDAHPDGPSVVWTLAVLEAGGSATCADVLCRAAPPVWTFRRAPPRRTVDPAV